MSKRCSAGKRLIGLKTKCECAMGLVELSGTSNMMMNTTKTTEKRVFEYFASLDSVSHANSAPTLH